MSLFARLRQREADGETAPVAVIGAGLIGRGIVRQIQLTPAMRPALVVNRTTDAAVRAYILAGFDRQSIVVSNDSKTLCEAVRSQQPAVTQSLEAIAEIPELQAVVEVTGAVEYGAQVAVAAINSGKHVIMMNAETDATVGPRLKTLADRAGVVYTNSDGDQPGVLKRLVEFVSGVGFEVIAAINCKGFMDIHATPDSVRPWAKSQNTSLPMTTAFTDGTKMNIENAVLANATDLVPGVRGMYGVSTDSTNAIRDCLAAFGDQRGLVDYTLGGDFAGGVFVIGYGDDPEMVLPYMRYLKMGDGPYYMFFRPYHLCHLETPLSIAEAILDHQPTIAPGNRLVAQVAAIAKRDLQPGERLDGIGGYTCYGEIEATGSAPQSLPIGLSEHAILTCPIAGDEPIPMHAVELDHRSTLMRLWNEQLATLEATAA